MLRARIIPSLLVRQSGLVKTRKFADEKYVGDPINAVRIFNEKEVDELIVSDIDATTEGCEPNYEMIARLAAECRMPLCYGGGITSVEQAKRIMGLGVEKVALSAAAVRRPGLVSQIAEQVGTQSVVVVLDVKKKFLGGYRIHIRNGTVDTKLDPAIFAREMEQRGAGEIVVNSIDHDGMMQGYDLVLASQVRDAVGLPMTILGGAGSYDHMREAAIRLGTIGLGAGSLFIFKGKYRAVLINYPGAEERAMIQRAVAR